MARALTAALLALTLPAYAAFPPRVEIRRLTKKSFARSDAGLVGVGDCLITHSEAEVVEVALVEVQVVVPWERSAEHVAKQSAAELGANCLMPLQEYGPEDGNYPVVRQYRAFFVTIVITVPHAAFRVPASARAFKRRSAADAATVPALGSLQPPRPAADTPPPLPAGAPYGPVWFEHALIESHDIELDLSRISAAEWTMVSADLARYFPSSEFQNLAAAYARGETVRLDLKELRVQRHEEPLPAPAARGRAIIERLP